MLFADNILTSSINKLECLSNLFGLKIVIECLISRFSSYINTHLISSFQHPHRPSLLFCNTNNIDTHTNNDTLVSDKSSSNTLGDIQHNEPQRQQSKQQKQPTLNIKKRQRQYHQTTPTNYYYISYYTMISLLIISTITWYQQSSNSLYVSSLSTTSNNYSTMRQISILKGTSNSSNKLARQFSGTRYNKRSSISMQLGSPPGKCSNVYSL